MVVAVQHARIKVCNVDIFPTVVVVVTHRHAEAPPAVLQARLDAYVRECAVLVVAVQFAGMAFASAQILQRGTVHKEDVQPPVVVIVKHPDAATYRLHDVALFRTAAGEMEVDSRAARHIHELR